MSVATKETPLQARLSHVLSRLRAVERKAIGHRDVLNEVIDELVRLYRDIGGVAEVAAPLPERPAASIRNLTQGNARRHAVKQHDGQRRCSRHNDGEGAWLPVAKFGVKNQARGTLRSWCSDCTKAYQRERYVSVAAKTMTVELIEGDRCVGHDCPVCGLPFEIGERVRGENLVHDKCQ